MATSHVAAPLSVETLQNDPASSNSPSLTPPETPVSAGPGPGPGDDGESSLKSYNQQRIVEFIYDLEIERVNNDDANSACIEFGRGVWSAVYKATTTWTRQSKFYASNNNPSSVFTPPHSPVPSRRSVVAVKSPLPSLRRDAQPVLRSEAWILSLVTTKARTTDHEQQQQYVVPFHGYVRASHSLVMQAIPLLLSTHVEECAEIAKRQFSTKTMFEPVLSAAHWRDLAAQLIRGLEWLHGKAGVVHGDIKPHNILLRRREDHRSSCGDDDTEEGFRYDALYADFSSAHQVVSSGEEQQQQQQEEEEEEHDEQQGQVAGAGASALTPPFAAPELMTVAAMKSTTIPTTPASDIFALGLTLLAAATGDTLVYSHSGTSDIQRLAMSREGYRALDYVRSGPHASRVVRDGLVEKVVAPAIVKEPCQRVLRVDLT